MNREGESGLRILIIDDDVLLGRALGRALREHEVAIETNAYVAIDRVTRAASDGQPFDMVLCDYCLGAVTGHDVFEALRASATPSMLFLMSGDHDAVDTATTADAVLLKPFSANDVRREIARIAPLRSRLKTA